MTHLTVTIYAQDWVVCGPVHPTPLFDLFGRHGYEPGILRECARTCLAQAVERPAVVVAPQYGLAVVGTSLVLDGEVVGAAVAGYALVDFVRSAAIEQLAREAGVPIGDLWDIARRFQPIPERRLVQQGELLQVLGDAVLRESSRTRRSEAMVTELTDESAARDDFLAVLSHELRTPLTPIRAWARILKLGGADGRTQRAAEVIERNALLQTRLVDDLIELNRANRGKLTLDPTPHDLNELLGSALEAVREDAREKGIALEVEEAGSRSSRMRTATVSNRSSATSSRTPSGSPRTVAASRCWRRGTPTRRPCASGTPARASPPSSCRMHSSHSGRRSAARVGDTPGSASGSRSSSS